MRAAIALLRGHETSSNSFAADNKPRELAGNKSSELSIGSWLIS
jgi:hypothetical protein